MAEELVTIGCKLPNGLIAELREAAGIQKTPYGETAVPGRLLQSIVLRGSAEQRRVESEGVTLAEVQTVVAGYGLTKVPKDFAEKWFAENADYPPVKRGQIIVWKSLAGAKSMAAERGEIKNGLEPVDPATKHGDGSVKIETRTDKDE